MNFPDTTSGMSENILECDLWGDPLSTRRCTNIVTQGNKSVTRKTNECGFVSDRSGSGRAAQMRCSLHPHRQAALVIRLSLILNHTVRPTWGGGG